MGFDSPHLHPLDQGSGSGSNRKGCERHKASKEYFEQEMEKFFRLYQRVDRQFYRQKVEEDIHYQRAVSGQNVTLAQAIASDILANYGYTRPKTPKPDNSN
jgi:hypothetical protein